MSVAIIDYGSGNLHSAAKAFERAAHEIDFEGDIWVTSDPDVVGRAERIVLPGVGAYADCKKSLEAISGMVEAINESIEKKGKPFFGICVGMHLLASHGFEHGYTQGFDWIPGEVKKITPTSPQFKIPHMGWNTLEQHASHPVLSGIPTGIDGWHAYFVHSYHLIAQHSHHVLAKTDHGGALTAIVGRDTIIGTQFHPEKSQQLGIALISNFLRWKP